MEVGCYDHLIILVPYMNTFNKYLPVIISSALYVLLWVLLQPVLGSNLDSDCVAYLTIAERMARGDYLNSINGLWSPLNSWILAVFIAEGADAWTSAKLLNFFFGSVVLIQVFFMFLKFKLSTYKIYYLQIALSIAMVYFVYFQMFGDILQLIFVLAYLFVLWYKKGCPIGYGRAAICGIIIGMAFYAKAYSFFFFGLHFLATLLWSVYQNRMALKKAAFVFITGITCAIMLMLPWTIALHQKYNEWSLNGQAGKLNMSWYINSGKSFRSDITLLIPPSYHDSPSFWEDPYLSQQNLSSPLSSPQHFMKWIFRVSHTCIVAIFCFQEISFLALAILLIALFYFFFSKKKTDTSDDDFQMQLLLITICLLPAGYLLMHIETRYIWLNVPLLMIAGAVMIEKLLNGKRNLVKRHFVYFTFALSFVVFPLYQFENLRDKNEDLFAIAETLKGKSIQGKFTSNAADAGRMWVIAWLTKSNYYTIERSTYSHHELLTEMKRYGVQYYFVESHNNVGELDITGMKKLYTLGTLEIFELL